MSFFAIFKEILGNNSVIGAISSSLLIIILGFYLTKIKVFSELFAKTLSTVILTVGLPALSFTSFMQDIDAHTLRQGLSILIWGFVFQGALIFLTQFYYHCYTGDRRKALSVLTTLGSTTFFGIPIIGAIYGAQGVLYASIFNISYRIYLYSWGYISFSGLQISKDNIKIMLLNPIIIATFVGLFIWVSQNFLPQVEIDGKSFAFLRLDKTAFWLYKPMTYLSSLSSPLAWLAIGATLGEVSLQEAIKDRTTWFYTLTKVVLVPLLCIVGLWTVNLFFPISFISLAVSVIMMATPSATVAVAYSIKFGREAVLSSNCSLVSTVVCILIMPLLLLVLEMLKNLGIFY